MNTSLLVTCLVAFVSAIEDPIRNYHKSVGIPLGVTIKAAEEASVNIVGGDKDRRVVGGAVSPNNAFPYLAGLVITLAHFSGTSVCGSSLLTPNRLVTAAHCWFDGEQQAASFEVVLGSSTLYRGGLRISTSSVYTHPAWNPSQLKNDVAMIHLPRRVPFSASVRPIALPSSNDMHNSFEGMITVAAGFGKTHDAQPGASSVVSHVQLRVISVAECRATFNNILPSNICTSGRGGVGTCGGDSGGPLVINKNGAPILIGITSFGSAAGCQKGYPSAFTRVTSFNSFIRQHM